MIKSVMCKTNKNASLRKFLNLSPNCICRLPVILYYHLNAIKEFIYSFFCSISAHASTASHTFGNKLNLFCVISFNTLRSSYSNKQHQCLQSVHCHAEWPHEEGKKCFQKSTTLHSAYKCSNCSILNFQFHQKRIAVDI